MRPTMHQAIQQILSGEVLVTLAENAHSALWMGRAGSYARIVATDELGAVIQPVYENGETGACAYVPWTAIYAIKMRPAPVSPA